MDKRRNKRFSTQLHVKLDSGSIKSWGVVHDVSENGLFIKGNQDFPVGEVIGIEIFMPDKTSCLLNGVVRRSFELSRSHRKRGVGIELTEKDARYLNFVKYLVTARIQEPENR